MDHKNNFKLSSNWTNLGIYGSAVLLIVLIPIFYLVMEGQEFHGGMAIAMLAGVGLFGAVIYQFIYAADARVVNGKLILKKQFRPKKEYAFERIGDVGSFEMRRTKYVIVKMKNGDSSTEKYLIVNGNGLLAFTNKDAEEMLLSLRDGERMA
ncbi:MAG: hypothetical protein ABI263_00545 [Gelidibacter sp.]